MMQHLDARFMANTKEIEGALDALCAMAPVEYEEDSGFGFRPRKTAIPAQDLECIPGATERNGIGHYYADPIAVIPHLVAAIKELRSEVAALKNRRTARSAEPKA